MTEVVLFPDAAAVWIGYLADALSDRDDDTPVVPRIPNPRPDRFVLVRRTGGVSRDRVIDDGQITVESWDTTDEDAHDLAQLCRGVLLAAVGNTYSGVALYRVVEVSGPANVPDPESQSPRYSQTFLTALRGVAEVLGS